MSAVAITSSLQFRKCAVTLQYRIPTKCFASAWAPTVCSRRGNVLAYTAQFNVEKQCDYPEIPESSWKITLEIGQAGGGMCAVLKPLRVADSPNSVLVELTIGPSAHTPSILLPGKPAELPEYRYDHENNLDDFVVNNYKRKSSGAMYTLQPLQSVYIGLSFRITRRPLELKSLLDAGTFTDCTLIANDGCKFPAHRVLLAAQSPVFLEMFQHATEPPSSGEHHLVDLSGDMLENLMGYLYNRGPIDTTANLEERWKVANMYDVKPLKAALEEMMVVKVNKSNAWHYLDFAREHGLNGLQKKAAEWIGNN